jgi:hypothetical protein
VLKFFVRLVFRYANLFVQSSSQHHRNFVELNQEPFLFVNHCYRFAFRLVSRFCARIVSIYAYVFARSYLKHHRNFVELN